MIVLVNPTNPTGPVFRRSELESLADIAERHDLLVLADEVYEFIVFDDGQHTSFASLPGMKERTVKVALVQHQSGCFLFEFRSEISSIPCHLAPWRQRLSANTQTSGCLRSLVALVRNQCHRVTLEILCVIPSLA